MIRCELVDDTLITVNGKEVRQDMEGKWIGKSLTATETVAFRMFMDAKRRVGKSLFAIEHKL